METVVAGTRKIALAIVLYSGVAQSAFAHTSHYSQPLDSPDLPVSDGQGACSALSTEWWTFLRVVKTCATKASGSRLYDGTAIGSTEFGTFLLNGYVPPLNTCREPQAAEWIDAQRQRIRIERQRKARRISHIRAPLGPPFVSGELFVSAGGSSNRGTASVAAGSSLTLNAVVQPIMSRTTQFMPDSYGADPGLLAVGSPALTNPVKFFDGLRPIGFGRLPANGTLATFAVENLQPGTHTYTAAYPTDRFYDTLWIGCVTVQVS